MIISRNMKHVTQFINQFIQVCIFFYWYFLMRLFLLLDKSIIPILLEARVHLSLVSLLKQFNRPLLQYEILCIFISMTSYQPTTTAEIVKAGLIPILLKLLISNYVNLVEQSLWIIGFYSYFLPFPYILLPTQEHYPSQSICNTVLAASEHSVGAQTVFLSIFF